MKKTSRRTPWRWTGPNLVLKGEDEQLWLCQDLPPVRERGARPVGMAISYSSNTDKLNEALLAFWRAFGHDSVLAAIHRKDGVSRLLLYTAAPQDVADRRFYTVRQLLRPPSIGVRLLVEPGWDALVELMSSVKNGDLQESLR
jgi:hypothetical protein